MTTALRPPLPDEGTAASRSSETDGPGDPQNPIAQQGRSRAQPRSGFVWLRSRWLLVSELLTLAVLVLLTSVFVRPLLETWGSIDWFNAVGLTPEIVTTVLEGTPLRPLQLLFATTAYLGGTADFAGFSLGAKPAYVVVFTVVLVGKYLVARWAVSPIVRGPNRWLLATLATVLFPWPAAWILEWGSAQVSAVLILVTLGACIRVRNRLRTGWVLLGAAGMLLSTATYQALFLCAWAIPLVAYFSLPSGWRQSGRAALRSAFPVLTGTVAYALYAFWAVAYAKGGGYEAATIGRGADDNPLNSPVRVLRYLYSTAYLDNPWVVPLLIAFLWCLVGVGLVVGRSKREAACSVGVVLAAIALLPLVALTYAENFTQLNDFYRVGFPLAFGFFLICVGAAARLPAAVTGVSTAAMSVVLVVGLLVGAIGTAALTNTSYQLQRSLLDELEPIMAAHEVNGSSTILVRDYTGEFGDRFTFFGQYVGTALRSEGFPVLDVVICTPEGTDRIHPQARAQTNVRGVPSAPVTPRCDGTLVRGAAPWLTLDVNTGPDDSLRVTLVP